MQSVSVVFYDDVLSQAYPAELIALDQYSVMLKYQDLAVNSSLQSRYFNIEQMTLITALDNTHPMIELTHHARIELLTNQLPQWLPLKHKNVQQKSSRLRKTATLIIFSLLLLIALGVSLLKWGIPIAAKAVAYQLPENTLQHIGSQAQAYVMAQTKPTQLPKGQQAQIQIQYLTKIASAHPATLIFRHGQQFGANALALPNNSIIVTDELVELTHSDQEILAILAHEQGHLIQRHSLQQALSNLGLNIVYIALTGNNSDLSSAIPVEVLGANYSRKFEQEADSYALELMQQHQIEVSHFANFLQRLSDRADEAQKDDPQPINNVDILASHPATQKRIQMIRTFEAKHPWVTQQSSSP